MRHFKILNSFLLFLLIITSIYVIPCFAEDTAYVWSSYEGLTPTSSIVTSKEEILRVSTSLIQKQGWKAINIRTVAKECNISVGSIYNYFHNKSDQIATTVERVWHDIFHLSDNTSDFKNFVDCVEWIFESMKQGEEKYPGFFAFHSMIFMEEEKESGQQLWWDISIIFFSLFFPDSLYK